MDILILDDDEERISKFAMSLTKPGTGLYIARTAGEAVSCLSRRHFDMVFLDHDLGLTPVPDPGNGTQVAIWVAAMSDYGRFKNTKFYVHSMNHPAALGMVRILRNAGLNVKDMPLVWEEMYRYARGA